MSAEVTRRSALASLGLWAAGSPLARAQQQAEPLLQGEPPGRIAPRAELVNVLEFESMAQRKLTSTIYAAIAGGDRKAFDRMIFRPRMFVNTSHLDMSLELFGDKMIAPILVGPASEQARFHPDAELATVRGASAALAGAVISDRSSQPIGKIAADAKTPLWYQIYPQADMAAVLARVKQAVKAGCKVVCLTVGTPYLPSINPRMDWQVVDQLRQAITVPLVVKGIMSPEEARLVVAKGAQGIVVSNHGGTFVPGMAAPIEMLTSIVDAVGGRIPVMIDGGFRRGSDIVKALALGARAVLVARPALWGLAAYGADGVQGVMEMLQSETARTMAGCGKPNLAALDRGLVRIVRR